MTQSKLIDAFVQRPQNFAWFLGAGASRNAGLPTATDIIWDLKRRLYRKEENQDIAPQDMQNEAVRAEIQQFMDARGFPPLWADEEYSLYFEKIFGDDKELQRRYLMAKLSEETVSLSMGNRVLGAFLAGGFTRAAFTTNFDTVVEKAVADVSGKSLSAYHLEGAGSAKRALDNEEYPFYCKLHGDFRYDSLKNLSADLATQNADLSASLINAGNRFGFIVAGYSGRDASVMALFHKVLESPNPFPHGPFWTGIGSSPHPAVKALITAAEVKNIDAQYVEIDTYDTLMSRLWRNLDGKPHDLDVKVRRASATSVVIPLAPPGTAAPLMRLNGLPVTAMPDQCFAAATKQPKDWAKLRLMRNDAEGQIILTKTETICCWGSEQNLRDAFGADLVDLSPRPVPSDFSLPENLPFKGLLEEALATGLVRNKPLLARMKPSAAYIIADTHAQDLAKLKPLRDIVQQIGGPVPGVMSPITQHHPAPVKVSWAEALCVSLDKRGDQTWVLLRPDVWIWPPHAREVAIPFLDKRKSGRFNKQHNDILGAWLKIILGTEDRNAEVSIAAFNGEPSIGNPVFKLGTRTAFARRRTG